jgi:hypothetical protein
MSGLAICPVPSVAVIGEGAAFLTAASASVGLTNLEYSEELRTNNARITQISIYLQDPFLRHG